MNERLKKLHEIYGKDKNEPDQFGRRTATPKEVEEALRKARQGYTPREGLSDIEQEFIEHERKS